ncbi:TrmH family RNA methyltransferase [Propionimicrobium lymphophilum]|uniref:TrmH family RNA methyltransferase n=1 Tax=Propionimicrobium lymphophilum TaxID=33012 RepID=UPI0023F0533C|nr:RNA methyltransferase [Propionimicrobium lymphophilum]
MSSSEAYNEPSVTPLSKTRARSVRALLRKKERAATGLFLAEGMQAVSEAMNYGFVETLIVDDIERFAGDFEGLEVLVGTRQQLAGFSQTVNTQDVFAICRNPAVGLGAIGQAKLVVICSQIRDPGNAGTVVRCADAFGADAVIFTNDSVELTNAKTVRASVGSIFHLPIAVDVEFADAIDWAHKRGLNVLAADAGGESINSLDLSKPTAWVFGNEAWGLTADISAQCDAVASIPMRGKAESLNLSTAAAVCLFSSQSAQS